MAIDIHSQIVDNDELHVPKGFTEADADQVPSKNSLGELEWVDTSGFSGPQGETGASGSISTVNVVAVSDPSIEMALVGIVTGEVVIAHEIISLLNDMSTTYMYDSSNTETVNSPYILNTLEGGATRWIAVGGKFTTQDITSLSTGRYISENEGHTLALSDSTGVVTGGIVSINGGDNTKFDIGAGEGHIVDSYTDPANPITSQVEWDAFTAITDDYLLTQPISFIGLERGTYNAATDTYGANIIQQTTPFTPEQLRDIISTSITTHVLNTNIEDITMNTRFIAAPINQLNDLATAVGTIAVSGNVYSYNVDELLKIDKSGGTTFNLGSNYAVSKKNPNIKTNPASVQTVFFGNYQDGVGGFSIVPVQTDIDANNWDDGSGVLQTVPNNRYSIFRVFYTLSDATIIHYGQALYTSISNAEAALNTEAFTKNPALGDSPLRSWIIVKGDTTDLSDETRVRFIEGGKFGSVASGATSATTTMQVSYNNSPEPEIKINTINGAVTYQDADTPTGVNILEVKDANAVNTLMSVDADGVQLNSGARVTTISTDGTFANDSDTEISTQKATKTYVDNLTVPSLYTANSVQTDQNRIYSLSNQSSSNLTFKATSTSANIYMDNVNLDLRDANGVSEIKLNAISNSQNISFGNGEFVMQNNGVSQFNMQGAAPYNGKVQFNTGVTVQAPDAGRKVEIGAQTIEFKDRTLGTIHGFFDVLGDFTLNNNLTVGRIEQSFGSSIFIGANAGAVDSLPAGGSSNTAVGFEVLQSNVSGTFNAAYGRGSARNFNSGDFNSVYGAFSGLGAVTGSNNSIFGSFAAQNLDGNSNSNVLIGYQCGSSLGVTSFNTFLGAFSGNDSTTTANSILIGHDVQAPTPTTSNCLNIGNAILGDVSTGVVNIPLLEASTSLKVGAGATITNVSTDGTLAGNSDTTIPTEQAVKTYVDASAGGGGDTIAPATSVDQSISRFNGTDNKTIEDSKVLIDDDGRLSQTGLGNSVFIGVNAGANNDLASRNNVNIGFEAGLDNISGTSNTHVGYQAGKDQINGAANTSLGDRCGGSSSAGAYTGSRNTSLGAQAGRNIWSASSDNLFAGNQAGVNASLANGNVILGSGSSGAPTLTTGDNNIIIKADVSIADAQDELNIGDIIKGDMSTNIVTMENLVLTGLPVYADEAAAVVGGIATDTIYKTVTGEIRIKL